MDINKSNNSDNKISNIYKFVFGALHSRLFNTILRIGVCDILEDGKPKSYIELAKITKTPEDAMIRMLRYFSFHGLFIQDKENPSMFSKSPINNLFIKSSNFYDLADLFSGDSYYDLYRSIPNSYIYHDIDGTSQSQITWDILESNENNEKFKSAMNGITLCVINDILENCDFSNSKIVVDLGGSHGELIKSIIKRYPSIERGINFDVEKVINLLPKSDDQRLSNVSGSFFESVPTGDTYILRQIIHDWQDKECIQILNTISKCMKPNAKIYIFDSIIYPNNYDIDSLNVDVKMFHFFRSKERTIEEFKSLICQTDFEIIDVFKFKSGGILLQKKL